MTTPSSPEKLGKMPVVEAVFELRFPAATQAADVLPGFLFSHLGGKIKQLPPSQIPKEIRGADKNLMHLPVVMLELDDYMINIGDRSLSVVCKLPYNVWSDFRGYIKKTLECISKINIIDSVNRFSLKYSYLIESDTVEGQIKMINGKIEVAGKDIVDSDFSLRIDLRENKFVHLVDIMTSIEGNDEGVNKKGLLISVDSIFQFNSISFSEWIEDYILDLDDLNLKNGKKFSSCVNKEMLTGLGYSYE